MFAAMDVAVWSSVGVVKVAVYAEEDVVVGKESEKRVGVVPVVVEVVV